MLPFLRNPAPQRARPHVHLAAFSSHPSRFGDRMRQNATLFDVFCRMSNRIPGVRHGEWASARTNCDIPGNDGSTAGLMRTVSEGSVGVVFKKIAGSGDA